jgi:hypothetical protein
VNQFASFENDWNPWAYLDDYYAFVEQDEYETLAFLVDSFREIHGNPIALEFGCGPMIAHLLPLVPYVSEIHIADYLKSNLAEVQKWQTNQADAHDWHCFTEFVLEQEDLAIPKLETVKAREDALKSKITKHLICNAADFNPLARSGCSQIYDFLLSCYCADSATSLKEEWFQYMRNILSLLRPGGYFVGAALRLCQSYKVKNLVFPCANVNEEDWETLFRSLQFDRVRIEVRHTPDHIPQGYDSILLVSGYKPNK